MNKTGRHGLIVVSAEGFADPEYAIPAKIFADAGFILTTASTKKTAVSMRNKQIDADILIDDVYPDAYSFISITGGSGSPRDLWNNKKLQSLAIRFHELGKPVGAICLSPVVLAHAGLLRGLQATVCLEPEAAEEFRKHEVDFVDTAVVVSGNIVTGRNPQSSEAYARALLDMAE